MPVPFEMITTRQVALAATYGYTPDEVAQDGVTAEYLEVSATAWERERKPSEHVSFEADSPLVRVHWDTIEESEAAVRARAEDWHETLERAGVTPPDPGRTRGTIAS